MKRKAIFLQVLKSIVFFLIVSSQAMVQAQIPTGVSDSSYPLLNKQMPAVKGTTIDGTVIDASFFQGKVTVLLSAT